MRAKRMSSLASAILAAEMLGMRRSLPDNLSPEAYLRAIQRDPRRLDDVPEAKVTPELCLEAVKRCGAALSLVPDRLKTPRLCLEAVKAPDAGSESVLKRVPQGA